MKFEDQFDEFLTKTVNLSDGRLRKLEDRTGAVERVLRKSADETLAVVDTRPQGSAAQKTIINPRDDVRGFDADLLVEFENRGVDPTELLRTVKAVLKASARHADLVHAKKRCITLDYAGEFHLDVVPCLRSGGLLYIANKETNAWEPTDPDGYTDWLETRDAHAGGLLVSTIRLCKYLRDYKGRPAIKSVILTTLLAQRVEARQDSDFEDLPTTLVLLLEDLASWCEQFPMAPVLREPTTPAELRLDDTDWGAFTRQIRSLATRAREALNAPGAEKSLAQWRKLFGDRFPAPARTVRLAEAALEGGEEDLYEKYGIPADLSGWVRVDARVRRSEGGGFRFGPIADLLPLQRRRQLDFRIDETSIEEPYDVYWKVKNHGPAAAAANGLRGEITPDHGGANAHKNESTLYRGEHYVEIYLVKDNVCVAKKRVLVPIQ